MNKYSKLLGLKNNVVVTLNAISYTNEAIQNTFVE